MSLILAVILIEDHNRFWIHSGSPIGFMLGCFFPFVWYDSRGPLSTELRHDRPGNPDEGDFGFYFGSRFHNTPVKFCGTDFEQ